MSDEKKDSMQSLGGKARNAALSKEERSRLASQAAQARWGILKATHQGTLGVGDIPCYVLQDGRRVLSGGGLVSALGMKRGSNPKLGSDRLANFVAGKAIKPFVSDDLMAAITSPIQFATPTGGALAYGYEATMLNGLCEALLAARRANALQTQQLHLANQAELLTLGLGRVGIIALVDEATGYQEDRAKDALARILEKFVVEEMRKWVKVFPTEFYKQIFRLRGWQFTEKSIGSKPPLVGKLTNNLVYARLAPGVLEELKRVTPKDDQGRHKHRLHQHLTEDIGHPKLREHLTGLIYLMKANTSWGAFLRQLDVAMPKFGNNFELELSDE